MQIAAPCQLKTSSVCYHFHFCVWVWIWISNFSFFFLRTHNYSFLCLPSKQTNLRIFVSSNVRTISCSLSTFHRTIGAASSYVN
ncbi:hypothetical protein S245_068906, partial [Arachis hypogaea]